MRPERWRQVDDVCQGALAREGKDRERYLDALCAGDPDLRREVESLLAAGHSADALLDTPPWEAAAREFGVDHEGTAILQPGALLGPFRIEALIGSGGMGEVYRARDTRLGRTVALKVLLPGSTDDPDRRRRLELEARAASALNHPHICTLLDIRCDAGVDYLVMEHVVGETLADRLERARDATGGGPPPFSLTEAIEFGAQVADALASAHQHGILHRDLKPGNVMLTPEGVKLLDFGLAKFKPLFAGTAAPDAGVAAPQTTPGAVLGTLNYMAPEQLNGGDPDARSDLFAFGTLLYEMVTGRRAFDGATPASVIAAILEREPRRPSEWQPLAPPALDRLVRGCLAKDPDKRWDSSRLAGEELRRIAASLEGQDDLRPSAADASGQPRGRRRWRPWVLGAGAAVLALLALQPTARRAVTPDAASPRLQRLPLDLGVTFALNQRLAGVALSPDGSYLAFNGTDATGRSGLFIRPLEEPAARLLVRRAVLQPAFSPDGQWLAGFTPGGRLVKVGVVDGTLVEICPSFVARGVSWIDNQTLVAALEPSDGLVRIPTTTGGVPIPLTRLDRAAGESTHRWPQAVPGAGVVVFTASNMNGHFDEARIEVVSLKTGRRAVLHRGGYGGRYLPTGHVVFVRHATLFALPVDLGRLAATGPPAPVVDGILADPSLGRLEFSWARSGTALALTGYRAPSLDELAWLTASGKREPLPLPADDYRDPRVSRDGRRVASVVGHEPNPQLLVYDRERERPVPLVSTTFDITPLWAPDGEHIVFGAEGEGGIHNLYWRRADGRGAVRQLTHSRNIQYASSFSPDGSRLAFGELSPESGGDIWILPLDLRNSDEPIPGKPEPYLRTADSETVPAFSPDGRWLAFGVARAGEEQVQIQVARSSGAADRWLVAAGDNPVWSRDGRQLLFQHQRRLMTLDVRVKDGVPQPGKPRPWASDAVVRVKFDSIRCFDVTPDPARVLMLFSAPPRPTDRPGPAVTLLVNLFDEVTRRTLTAR